MTLHFVLPLDGEPSGGNIYDRMVAESLGARQIPVAGTWPRPDADARADLAATLGALPDDALVLIDGLVACGVPDVLQPHAGRLRIAILVHLPLADEVGLDPIVASELDRSERRALALADVVVATSPWAARTLITRHDLPAERVRAVPPGVRAGTRSAPDPAGTRLLCAASITPRKGQDVLVEALASVADLPWTCACVGPLTRSPGFTEAVRTRIDHHGLTDRITLTGPRADMGPVYAEADLLVLPSRAETFGMVITEALAHGVPVLATTVGGIPNALGDAPALLVPPNDTPALADALRRWLTEPALRTHLRTAHAPTRSWTDCARELAEALR